MDYQEYIEKVRELYVHNLTVQIRKMIAEVRALVIFEIEAEKMLNAKYEQLMSDSEYLVGTDMESYYLGYLKSAIENDFRNYTYSSLFLLAYATFEEHLDRLCKYLSQTFDFSLQPNDLKGNGIERSKRYMLKVVGIKFPSDSAEWNRIFAHYNKVRNLFAHSNGNTEEWNDNKGLVNAVKSLKSVSIVGSKVVLQHGFCKNFLFDCEYIYSRLIDDVENFVAVSRFLKAKSIWQFKEGIQT